MPIIPFLFSFFFSFSFLSLFSFSLHLISSPHRVLIFSLSCSRSSVCSASSSSSSSRPRRLAHGVEVRRLGHRPLPHLCAALADHHVSSNHHRLALRSGKLAWPPAPRRHSSLASPLPLPCPGSGVSAQSASASPTLGGRAVWGGPTCLDGGAGGSQYFQLRLSLMPPLSVFSGASSKERSGEHPFGW